VSRLLLKTYQNGYGSHVVQKSVLIIELQFRSVIELDTMTTVQEIVIDSNSFEN